MNKSMTGQSNSFPQKQQLYLSGLRLSPHVHPAGFRPLTIEVLEEIVNRIVSNLSVQKIILFGSYADVSGQITPDSDIDLLVIMETTKALSERILSVSRLIRPRPFPMDILVRTPLEISTLLETKNVFFTEIITKGRVIYER